jgi:hypothetical protein
MLKISEGTEVLLKTGEAVTVVSGYENWRGMRWTGKGYHGGKDIQRDFYEDDVRAVLGQGRATSARSTSVDSTTATLF